MMKLPFPPASLVPHAKGSYFGKMRVTKAWRKIARDATDKYGLSVSKGDTDIVVHCSFFPPNRNGDRVNFPLRMKPIFDGIADALGVNDKRFVSKFYFCPVDKEDPRIEIRIGETTDVF